MIGNCIFTYWLPFAYQAKGSSAQQSGINIIPFTMALVSGSGIGGWLNSATGRHTPFLVLGSAICAIAGGLFFATDENTSTAKLVGYQILLGFGQGMAINQPC
jgi:cyanate permease